MSIEQYSIDSELLPRLLGAECTFLAYHTLLNKFSEKGCDTNEMSNETGLSVYETHRVLNKMIGYGIVERTEVKKKQKHRRLPIKRHIYKHTIQDDSKIVSMMKETKDPDEAYEKLQSVFDDIIESGREDPVNLTTDSFDM